MGDFMRKSKDNLRLASVDYMRKIKDNMRLSSVGFSRKCKVGKTSAHVHSHFVPPNRSSKGFKSSSGFSESKMRSSLGFKIVNTSQSKQPANAPGQQPMRTLEIKDTRAGSK